MSHGPDIPAAEHEAFANPPLKTMLGQVRFPAILRIADLGALGAFKKLSKRTGRSSITSSS